MFDAGHRERGDCEVLRFRLTLYVSFTNEGDIPVIPVRTMTFSLAGNMRYFKLRLGALRFSDFCMDNRHRACKIRYAQS